MAGCTGARGLDSGMRLAGTLDLSRLMGNFQSSRPVVHDDPWDAWPVASRRVLFVGMGSSLYASSAAAARLRHAGIDAVAELASRDLLPPATPDTVPMRCGPEVGGVAYRSYQHTLGLLLALEALLGPDGTHLVAPAHRLASAWQGALMLREGPRLSATGSETGDWSHVDVYLTKTTDYRMLLFAGSRWEDELLDWTGQRGSTVVAVGAEVPSAVQSLRYRDDDNDDVRLLTEVLVPELIAQAAWSKQASP